VLFDHVQTGLTSWEKPSEDYAAEDVQDTSSKGAGWFGLGKSTVPSAAGAHEPTLRHRPQQQQQQQQTDYQDDYAAETDAGSGVYEPPVAAGEWQGSADSDTPSETLQQQQQQPAAVAEQTAPSGSASLYEPNYYDDEYVPVAAGSCDTAAAQDSSTAAEQSTVPQGSVEQTAVAAAYIPAQASGWEDSSATAAAPLYDTAYEYDTSAQPTAAAAAADRRTPAEVKAQLEATEAALDIRTKECTTLKVLADSAKVEAANRTAEAAAPQHKLKACEERAAAAAEQYQEAAANATRIQEQLESVQKNVTRLGGQLTVARANCATAVEKRQKAEETATALKDELDEALEVR
jgi:hypothetical protein